MKISWAVFFLAIVGCAPTPYVEKYYNENQTSSVTPGESIIRWDIGSRSGGTSYGYRKELVYGGIDGNTLQVDYRVTDYYVTSTWNNMESLDNQQLKYDLTKSDTVAYLDILVKVLNATPNKMDFVILRGPAEAEASNHSLEKQ